jgi:hypothetical protein
MILFSFVGTFIDIRLSILEIETLSTAHVVIIHSSLLKVHTLEGILVIPASVNQFCDCSVSV